MTDTQVVVFFLGIFILLLITVVVGYALAKIVVDVMPNHEENQHEEEILDTSYVPPVLKELSPKQIEDIHARGNITPAEYVEQWERIGMCWVISEDIAAPCCEHFRSNCHDCLVALANRADEHTSLMDFFKRYNDDI